MLAPLLLSLSLSVAEPRGINPELYALPPEPEAPAAVAETTEPDDDSDDEAAAAEEAPGGAEAESQQATASAPRLGGPLYSADLSDEELAKRFKDDLASLGSMSIGFADAGRIINGQQCPAAPNLQVVQPDHAYGTHETIEYLQAVAKRMSEEFPESPPLRINHIGAKDGGYLWPHQSHQSGRDVDVGFYYPGGNMVTKRDREHYMDLPRNWAFLKAVVTLTDVQFVLLDRRVQKVLYDYALKHGEDQAWLDSLFHSGKDSLVQHARKHRDHFHVRFYNPRAQELGRRVIPFMAEQPEHNVTMHRVRKGDTLGHIAVKYGVTLASLRKANHLKHDFLRLGVMLTVPLRGPCTHCPTPPEVVVPPRRLPPELQHVAAVSR